MKTVTTILTLCALAGPAVAAPTVPDEALALVPADVQSTWLAKESAISALDDDIEAAEVTLASAVVDTADARTSAMAADAVADSTRGSEMGTRDSGQLDVDVAKAGVDQSRIAKSLAGLGVDRARDDLGHARTNGSKALVLQARSALTTAKLDEKRAKVALREAKRGRSSARDRRKARNDGTSEEIASAEDTSDAADQAVAVADSRQVGVGADLALLRARRDVAAATLELTQAEAAVAAGADLEVAPFADALALASEQEAAARAAL